jgi:hypothetical protein
MRILGLFLRRTPARDQLDALVVAAVLHAVQAGAQPAWRMAYAGMLSGMPGSLPGASCLSLLGIAAVPERCALQAPARERAQLPAPPPGSPAPPPPSVGELTTGSLWITARSARVGDIDYQRLPPVLVAVVGSEDRAAVTWLHCVAFSVHEADARAGELVFGESASSLGLALRFDVDHRLRLRAEQLGNCVGQLTADGHADLRATLAGDPEPLRSGVVRVSHDAASAAEDRVDPTVLMVLQQPWWHATGRA